MVESRLQRITLFIVALIGLVFIVVQARSFLIPFVFSTFFALMLLPVVSLVQKAVRYRILAIFLTLILVLLVILGVISLFAFEMVDVVDNLGAIGNTMASGIENLTALVSEIEFMRSIDIQSWVSEHIGTLIEKPISWIQQAVLGSTTFMAGLTLTVIYLFFILLYAQAFRRLIIIQTSPDYRDEFKEMLQQIQKVSLKYLVGMFTVILILGVLNSAGLWLIGVDFAIFWGFLAAFLVIIPYIGTILGGVMPFLYAIPTSDSWTTPILVVVLFVVVQALEGNFITPKIVGNSVNINPFVAIVALVLGGAIWGIPGMILAIPLTAIIKIFFSVMHPTKPFAVVMGDDPETQTLNMEEEYSDPKFSFWNWLTKGN